jgi:hypothetical protein
MFYTQNQTIFIILLDDNERKSTLFNINHRQRWLKQRHFIFYGISTAFLFCVFQTEVLRKTLNKNLFITTDVAGGIADADVVFIAVNTGTKDFGHWVSVDAREILRFGLTTTMFLCR